MEVLMGKLSINGLFSMAMLNNQMVYHDIPPLQTHLWAVETEAEADCSERTVHAHPVPRAEAPAEKINPAHARWCPIVS